MIRMKFFPPFVLSLMFGFVLSLLLTKETMASNVNFVKWSASGFLYPEVNSEGSRVAAFNNGYLEIYALDHSDNIGSKLWSARKNMPNYYIPSFKWMGDYVIYCAIPNGGLPASDEGRVDTLTKSGKGKVLCLDIVNMSQSIVSTHANLGIATNTVLNLVCLSDPTIGNDQQVTIFHKTKARFSKISSLLLKKGTGSISSVIFAVSNDGIFFLEQFKSKNKFYEDDDYFSRIVLQKTSGSLSTLSPSNLSIDERTLHYNKLGAISFIGSYFGKSAHAFNIINNVSKVGISLNSVRSSLKKIDPSIRDYTFIGNSPNNRFIAFTSKGNNFSDYSVIFVDTLSNKYKRFQGMPNVNRLHMWARSGILSSYSTEDDVFYGFMKFNQNESTASWKKLEVLKK